MTRTGNKMKYKAVIFDMDGVLIDSEYFYLERTYRELVKRYPWIRIEELYPIVGMSGKTERILMHELARRPLDDLQFDEELEEIYQSSHIADFTEVLYPEVKEILRWLKEQGLQIALASSSPVHCISQMLDQCDIRDYFESVISGESLVMSKPDPEIYQITMKQAWKKAGRVSDRGGFYLWGSRQAWQQELRLRREKMNASALSSQRQHITSLL